MRLSMRACAAVAVLAGVFGGVPAAQAAPDGWTLISTSEAPAPVVGLSGLPRVDVARDGAPGAVCEPKSKSMTVFPLRDKTWLSPTGEIAYQWFGSGQVRTSTDCSRGVRMEVQVIDYAPSGRPPMVAGPHATSESTTAITLDGAKRYVANATAESWVAYFEGPNVRGPSLVEIRVRGWYYNPSTKQWTYMGCVNTYTPVTPTPAGPIYGQPTDQAPCP